MRYFELPTPNEILWSDAAGNSGIIRPTDGAPWAAYLSWVGKGGVPESLDPPCIPDLPRAQHEAMQRLHAAVDAALDPIVSQYPAWEQLAEARAWSADAAAATPLLDALQGGRDRAALCASIISKADAYKAASGAVFAWRHACSIWIEASAEVAALAAWRPQYPEPPPAD
jgi:hypothetical protein